MTTFQEARAFLLKHRTDYDAAVKGFRWPDPVPFNWALDWFDAELAGNADSRDRTALWIVDAGSDKQTKLSFAALSRRSNQVANFLRAQGLKRGDHLLLLLGNVVPLWETMLAAIKLGVVVIPATTLLTPDELRDRLDRGRAKVVVASQDQVAKFAGLGAEKLVRIVVGASSKHDGWLPFEVASSASETFAAGWPDQRRRSDAALFHLGHHGQAKAGTAQPAQLSDRRAIDDVLARLAAGRCPSEHLLAGLGQACLELLLRAVECRCRRVRGQSTALRRQGVARDRRPLRRHHAVRAADGVAAVHSGAAGGFQGVVARSLRRRRTAQSRSDRSGQAAWGLTIRDGYGQTETTALAGNSPGQKVKVGSMGRPLPGYRVQITDNDGHVTKEGEVTLVLGAIRPAGLMQGYQGDDGKLSGADGDLYRSGDVVFADDEGYLTFVGRSDDVFKSSDYRISPFELESVLLEHEAVAEAAVVPSPDPIRLAVPKAYVLLVAEVAPSPATALSIFQHLHSRLAPFKRIRRIELVKELPKTISGKIRRVQLRRLEHDNNRDDTLRGQEFREEEFPELQKVRTAGSEN